jgi:4-hydroxy-tetrahydrodipicolinate synthase
MAQPDIVLQNIIPATVLPFTDDGDPDLPTYESFVMHLVESGVGGVCVNADSGEGMSLYPEERRQVTKSAVRAVEGRVPVVCGVFAGFTSEAQRRAEEAAEDGATALLVFPSIYFRGQSLNPEIVVNYYRAIHRASGLPLVAFQLLDDLGGVEYDTLTLIAIMSEPGVIAIKDASFDARKFRTTMNAIRSHVPDRSILSGNDNFIYESLLMGADGALIGAGSFATSLQVALYCAIRDRRFDDATSLAEQLDPLVQVLFRQPIRNYRVRIKEGLVAQGLFRSAMVREPLTPLDKEEATAIRRLAATVTP